MPRYEIPAQALRELDEERKAIVRRLGMHLITLEQAQRMAEDATRRMCAQARIVDGSGETFPIKCNGCGEITVVANDVLRYWCHCSPDVERFTFQSRKLDIKIGQRGIDDYASANVGRQTLNLP